MSLETLVAWLADAAHWQGSDGIPTRVTQHLGLSAVAVLIATAVALPAGILLGHTAAGRGW